MTSMDSSVRRFMDNSPTNQLADKPTRRQQTRRQTNSPTIKLDKKPTRRNWNCHQNRCKIFWTHGRVFQVILSKKKLATRCRCDCCQQRRRHGHEDGMAKLRRVPKARELRRPRCRSPRSRLGVWGSIISSPSGVWGGAPAAIEFCSFYFPFHAFWTIQIQIQYHPRMSSNTSQMLSPPTADVD